MDALSRDSVLLAALLKGGLSATARDEQGRTPLMQPGLTGEAIRLLVGAGAEVNARDGAGYTALYYLADLLPGCIGYCIPELEPLEALLELGADPNLGPQSLTELAYSMVCSALEMNQARAFEDFLRGHGYTR